MLHGIAGHYSTPDRNQPWNENVIETPKLGTHTQLCWECLAAGGLCSTSWKPFVSLHEELRGDVLSRASPRNSHEYCECSLLGEMSLFWKYLMNISSRGKTKILLLLRTNTAVKGWGVFDSYTNTQQFITNMGPRLCAEQGNTGQLCLRCTVKWVLHPSQKIQNLHLIIHFLM